MNPTILLLLNFSCVAHLYCINGATINFKIYQYQKFKW